MFFILLTFFKTLALWDLLHEILARAEIKETGPADCQKDKVYGIIMSF